jgi:hypothetical protein
MTFLNQHEKRLDVVSVIPHACLIFVPIQRAFTTFSIECTPEDVECI